MSETAALQLTPTSFLRHLARHTLLVSRSLRLRLHNRLRSLVPAGLKHVGFVLGILPFEEKRTRKNTNKNGFINNDPNNVDEYPCGSWCVSNGPSVSLRICPPPGCPP